MGVWLVATEAYHQAIVELHAFASRRIAARDAPLDAIVTAEQAQALQAISAFLDGLQVQMVSANDAR